jgi:hypothetical protein
VNGFNSKRGAESHSSCLVPGTECSWVFKNQNVVKEQIQSKQGLEGIALAEVLNLNRFDCLLGELDSPYSIIIQQKT